MARALTRSSRSTATRRLAAQLLSGRAKRDPVDVAERLLAIQAQDLRGAHLAVHARTRGVSVVDIDRALTADRSLVITWLNRGTLQLVRSEDYWWLQELTTPQLFTANARRLGQEGVSQRTAERGVKAIVRAIERDGPMTRRRLRGRLIEAKVPVEGQALVHLLMLASLRGLIVRGPMSGADHAFVLVRDWLGEPPRIDRERALAELARRFLAGHGPATDRDLAAWAGLPLRDARAGLKAIRSVERGEGLFDLARRGTGDELPPPRLLGPWEPILVGYRDREWVLGAQKPLITVEGLFRPFVLVRGRAAGVWSMQSGRPVIEPLTRLSRSDSMALEIDAADVIRFLTRNGT